MRWRSPGARRWSPDWRLAASRSFPTRATRSDRRRRSCRWFEFDLERENRVLREGFACSHARRRAKVVLELCAQWRTDAIVCDEVDFGAMIADP
jgi:hypothetical protein